MFGKKLSCPGRFVVWPLLILSLSCGVKEPAGGQSPVELLNVSYDPTRELYQEYNAAFIKHWQATAGQAVTIRQSHGGSGSQSQAVINGLEADVVTLALSFDIDVIRTKAGLLKEGWQDTFPRRSCPYTSTIVMLVRKGNPKGIRNWDDLIRPGTGVITPNPKTSGGARWNYLAAWGFALRQPGTDENGALQFVTELFRNVPVLDSGARGSTVTFVERNLGDVLLAWENEALLVTRKLAPERFEIVYPPLSILAEPPVAIVDRNADARGTRKLATAYLEYLYSPEGQEIAAKHFYRPQDAAVLKQFESTFPQIELLTIDGLCGGWEPAQKKHFSDGGLFDRVMENVHRQKAE